MNIGLKDFFAGAGRSWILGCVACVVLSISVAGCASKSSQSPSDTLREGWKQYRLSEFNIATTLFQTVENAQPAGSEYRVQALYGEASCWNHRRDNRDVTKAVSLYQTIMTEAPGNPLVAWCALDLVRTRHLAPAEDTLDYERLSQDYADVYGKYPATPAGEEAFLFHVNLLSLISKPADGPRILQEITAFLKDHPKTLYVATLYGVMGDCYHRMGREEDSLSCMIKSLQASQAQDVDTGEPSTEYSNTYWSIAYRAEFEAGDFGIARQYYQRLLKEYPEDMRVVAVEKALARMDAVEAALRSGHSLPPEFTGGVSQ